MIIAVDMDETIAKWESEYDRLLDLEGQSAMGIPRATGKSSFDLFSDRTEEERETVLKVMNTPGFYRNLEPISGAKEALNEMLELGHVVYIVSSPFPSNPTCASDKYDWVVENYGDDWAKRVILTQDKTAVVADVLIDDKPNIKGMLEPEWQHVVFDHSWNRHITDKPRIYSWSNWKSVVLAQRYALL